MSERSPGAPALSVVIPVHNEAESLAQLRERLGRALDGTGLAYEILFVDDHSADGTLEAIRRFHAADSRVKAISFSRNFGHQAAVTAGLHHASGEAVVIMDGDLQDPPELISRFVEAWRAGDAVVYGIRRNRKEDPLKKFCYWLYYRLLRRLADIDIPPDSGDFCLMDRKVVAVLNAMRERNRFVRGLRSWAGFRHRGVPYERDRRHAGTSKYGYFRLLKLGMDGIVSFSGAPLRLSIGLGFAISGASLVYALYIAADRLWGGPGSERIPGWATLVVAVLFLSGVQLIVLGLAGEYLMRIYDEVKGRPPYVLQERIGVGHAEGIGRHPGL